MLRQRLQSVDGIIANLSKKEDALTRTAFAVQDREQPMRDKIDALDKEAKENLGMSWGGSVIDFVTHGTLQPSTALDAILAFRAFAEAQGVNGSLEKAHAETLQAFEKIEPTKAKILMWAKDREYTSEILDYRDRKTHENQRGRRRYGR